MFQATIAALVLLLTGATPVADPSALLEQARAARASGDSATHQRLLERVVDKFDGTDLAVAAAEELLDLLVRRWTARDRSIDEVLAAHDAMNRRAQQIIRSRSFHHPRAGRLRNLAWRLALDDATPGWKGKFTARRYLDCAERTLELAAALDPGDELTPPTLLNAAWCYETAASAADSLTGAGILADAKRLYTRIVAEHPDAEVSRHAVKALVRIELAGGRFAEVARLAESLVQRYPSDSDAGELLQTAHEIRLGLGDTTQAQADAARHAELRGPLAHALEFYAVRHATATSDAERVAHSRELLRLGNQLPLAVRATASATYGASLWQQACSTPGEAGLCVSRDAQPRCGRAGWTLHTRDRRSAAEAQLQLSLAVQAARRTAPEAADFPDFTTATLHARIAVIDAQLERMLSDLADPRHRGAESRDARARRIRTQYEHIAAELDTDAAEIAALGRTGQLAELQAGVTTRCDDPTARTLLADAAHAYRRCLALSTASGQFDATFSRACEAGLLRLDPRGYPRLAELFGDRAPPTPRPDWIGAQTELP